MLRDALMLQNVSRRAVVAACVWMLLEEATLSGLFVGSRGLGNPFRLLMDRPLT